MAEQKSSMADIYAFASTYKIKAIILQSLQEDYHVGTVPENIVFLIIY